MALLEITSSTAENLTPLMPQGQPMKTAGLFFGFFDEQLECDSPSLLKNRAIEQCTRDRDIQIQRRLPCLNSLIRIQYTKTILGFRDWLGVR